MGDPSPITHSLDADGIGWIVLDDPSNRANAITPATQLALRSALAALAAAPVRAVVIHSAKERFFCAGADLKWMSALADARIAMQTSRHGQEVFNLVGDFKVPVVCAIHGTCAGGGLELALACHWRLASDARETSLGLTEVGLGLIPGWGGCTRLPRLIGTTAAVEHMLKATLISAVRARQLGLVDELAPAAEIKARAKATALRLAAEGVRHRGSPPAAAVEGFFDQQRRRMSLRRNGQPAPLVLLDAVEQSLELALAPALEFEAQAFGSLATGEVAKNMLQVFNLKNRAKKVSLDAWYPDQPAEAIEPKPFRTIGILGAGVMGSGIAQLCASRGYGVIMCDTSRQAIERGVAVIRGLFADAVKRGDLTYDAAHKMTGGIGITTSTEDFEICDMVIEAIVEDVAQKQEVLAELTTRVSPSCMIASNTSALLIEDIGARAQDPTRIVGLHFFNPVGRMPVVEVVLGAKTSRATADRALAFVHALGRTPVVCRSSPGFLVTRVLFFYLNEACRLWERGVALEAIDQAMRDWGWPMGPMRLIDEVGVDVTDFIFGEMQGYYPGRFTSTSVCRRLVAAGMAGRKNGAGTGFYQYVGSKESPNPAAVALPEVPALRMSADAIVNKLMGVMIDESKRALADGVVKTSDDIDLALLLGAGFPAHRGGLMRYARRVGLFP